MLVLYDVTTLYFETDTADEFRIPGFSKERRLEPQITIGLLVDGTGFPLMVQAFEGNKAETTTMLPTIDAFKAGGVPRPPLLAATLTSVVAGDNPAGEHRAIWFQELTGDLQTERVQPGERGQIRGRKSRVSHVEVFREDSVRTSIIGRPRPRSRLRRADLDYTVNCEEPLN